LVEKLNNLLWTQRMESPPSFCNGLGTIYIASSQGRTFDLTTRDVGSEFRYVLGKVLGTQDCPTLRLDSHHCVLCLNLIKNMFITCIYTHTQTNIHLSIQSWHHSSQNTYISTLRQKRAKPIRT